MDKNKIEKEFCIYIRNGRGTPYNISPYYNFQDTLIALNNMVSLELERGRFFYVDNDFYDNKYPPNMYGKYFCIDVAILKNRVENREATNYFMEI